MTEEAVEYVYGHKRNDLVHAVIWPKGPAALAILYDTDGVIQGDVPIKDPVRGSVFANMMPEGYQISFSDCGVMSMSGELVIATRTPFDTCVVTEKREMTFEDRLIAMERRDRRRQLREQEREREHAELLRRAEEREQERLEPVVEEDAVQDSTQPTTEPEEPTNA